MPRTELKAFLTFLAGAAHGASDHLKRLAALRERNPELADGVEALVAAQSAKCTAITLSPAAISAEGRELGRAQMAALTQKRPR